MSFTDLKNNGGITLLKNPKDQEHWWFTKGRRLNYETRCIYDKDGYNRWGQEVKEVGWQGKRFRKMIKKI